MQQRQQRENNMDFKKILSKLDLFEGLNQGSGPKFPGKWKGTDADTPGKKVVGDSILKDLGKGPTAKTKEQELAEAYQSFLENNQETEINPDTMLTFLRNGFKRINDYADSYSDEAMSSVIHLYTALRVPLMKGDVQGFHDMYSRMSAKYPDAFDAFMEEVYDNVEVNDYDSFIHAATDADLSEDDLGVSPKRPIRTGARHARGHEPVSGYRTVKASEESTDESRGHKVIASKLKDIESRNQPSDDDEAFQAHLSRMQAKMKEYRASNPKSIYKKVDEYGANQPVGTAGQKMVQTAMPTTQDVAAATNQGTPQQVAATAQATQTIKAASGATAPNNVIAKALDAVSKGQQVSPQDMKTLQPILQNVATAGQDPALANDYKTLANKAKIFQQTQK